MLKDRNHISAENYIQRLKEYKDWIKTVKIFSNKNVITFIVIGAMVLIIGRVANIVFFEVTGGIIALYFIGELIKRDAHEEGYLDGYEQALHDFEIEKLETDMDFDLEEELDLEDDDLENIK